MTSLARLVLTNFRNLSRFEVGEVPPVGVVALVGPNGVGKTSILEALSLLDGSRGLLGDDPKAMVRAGCEKEGFGVYAEMADGRSVGVGYRAGQRRIELDGVPAKADDLAKVCCVASMAPVLDRMFYEAPAGRRALLDDWAGQLEVTHIEAVERYTQHTRNRLRILLQNGAADWLDAEEHLAAVWGVKVLAGRVAYVAGLMHHAEGLRVALGGAAQEVLAAPNPVEALKGKLERSRAIDTRLERTSAGPNTVDVVAELHMGGRWVVAKQSSSGQHKRVMMRWLCAHVRALRAGGLAPLVLVDELSAHLDATGVDEALAALQGLGGQVWVSDVVAPKSGWVVAL